MKLKRLLAASFIICFFFIALNGAGASSADTIETDLNGIRDVIRDELDGYIASDLLIIKGSNLYIQEEMLMAVARLQLPKINQIRMVMDSNINNISITASQYEKLIFLGGPQTNDIVDSLDAENDIEVTTIYSYTSFLISVASIPSMETEVLILSSTLEETMLTNKAPERSILSQIMDKRLIPIVATITSISILQLINVFGTTVSEFFFDFTSEKLGTRKKEKHQTKKERSKKRSNRIIKEITSILLASIIFALALSWSWTDDLSNILHLFIINFLVIGLFYLIRESLRVHYSKKYQLHTEHVFWPLGSVLNVGSTILGNTFSLASYTYLENEESEQRYSKMYYTIFKILFIVTICSFFINIFFPATALQMFYVFTIMSLFIDMTPIKPLDGYEVKQWNKRKWLLLYIFVFISYFIIMFSTFI